MEPSAPTRAGVWVGAKFPKQQRCRRDAALPTGQVERGGGAPPEDRERRVHELRVLGEHIVHPANQDRVPAEQAIRVAAGIGVMSTGPTCAQFQVSHDVATETGELITVGAIEVDGRLVGFRTA